MSARATQEGGQGGGQGGGQDRVRAQYEALPYPARDPADEAKRLVTGSPSHWPEMLHHLFAGRPPAGRGGKGRPMRVLVAGCGAGDGLVMLAQQSRDAGVAADILALDLSDAALGIARARLAERGLTERVRLVRGSLLDAPEHARDGGLFDYIDCCGVLHHLPQPQAGFRALAEALAPTGGMGLMVYAGYGRTGVYELQETLRRLAPEGLAPDARLAVARRVLAALPETNRFRRNPFLKDHLDSDAGLYDLLLHAIDRAYRADDLLRQIEAAGLRLASWIDPLRYDPALYLPAEDAAAAAGLDPAGRAATAEALAGNLRKHICYVVPADRSGETAAPIAPDAVPVWRDAQTQRFFHGVPDGAASLPLSIDGLTLELPLPAQAAPLIRLIDGKRSLEAIRKKLPDRPDRAAFKARVEALMRPLAGFSKLFLSR